MIKINLPALVEVEKDDDVGGVVGARHGSGSAHGVTDRVSVLRDGPSVDVLRRRGRRRRARHRSRMLSRRGTSRRTRRAFARGRWLGLLREGVGDALRVAGAPFTGVDAPLRGL